MRWSLGEVFLGFHSGKALEHASEDMKADRDIVLAAFQQMGLTFTDKEKKTTRSLVLAAVKQSGNAFEHASEEMTIGKATASFIGDMPA